MLYYIILDNPSELLIILIRTIIFKEKFLFIIDIKKSGGYS
jgi:hypothetical protein